MVRIGTPSQPDKYFSTDNSEDILKIHQAGYPPEWRELDGTCYWRITNKLIKALKKYNIDL